VSDEFEVKVTVVHCSDSVAETRNIEELGLFDNLDSLRFFKIRIHCQNQNYNLIL